MNSIQDEICAECGTTMGISTGPGRIRSYRGDPGYEIPSNIAFFACPHCGAEWMAASQIEQMSDAFELERHRRRSAARFRIDVFSRGGNYTNIVTVRSEPGDVLFAQIRRNVFPVDTKNKTLVARAEAVGDRDSRNSPVPPHADP